MVQCKSWVEERAGGSHPPVDHGLNFTLECERGQQPTEEEGCESALKWAKSWYGWPRGN